MDASRVRSETDALSLRLRAATHSAHEALEATPFSRRLSAGTLDLPAYARYLTAMWHFHSALEDAAATATASDAAVRSVWREDMRRASAIEADLEALERDNAVGGTLLEPGATAPFSSLVADVRTGDRQRVGPHLIGLLYVSEGSRLGGRVLRKSLRARYPVLDEAGLAYLDGYGEETGRQWTGFRARLDGLVLGNDGERAAIDGASAGFRAVKRAFSGL